MTNKKTPKATTPKATTPKATTPKATTPKATTPKATTPKATTPTEQQQALLNDLQKAFSADSTDNPTALLQQVIAAVPAAATLQIKTKKATKKYASIGAGKNMLGHKVKSINNVMDKLFLAGLYTFEAMAKQLQADVQAYVNAGGKCGALASYTAPKGVGIKYCMSKLNNHSRWLQQTGVAVITVDDKTNVITGYVTGTEPVVEPVVEPAKVASK